MKHIFINDFLEQYFVYEEDTLVKKDGYTDPEFIKEYSDFDLCLISNNSNLLSQYDELVLKDWQDRFLKSIGKSTKSKLWFMGKNLQFHLLEPLQNLSADMIADSIPHICIGGGFDGCDLQLSIGDFCLRVIELYKPRVNESQTNNIDKDLLALKNSVATLNEGIDEIKQLLKSNNDSELDEINRSLKEELTAYRADFYLKSVQRLGLDALLEIMDRLCTRLYNSSNSSDEIKEVLNYVINLIERTLRSKFHVRCVSSESGTQFNSETMIAYPDDSISTEDTSLIGCVAQSISPAIYWTIPRVNSCEMEFLYKEENVVLYQE